MTVLPDLSAIYAAVEAELCAAGRAQTTVPFSLVAVDATLTALGLKQVGWYCGVTHRAGETGRGTVTGTLAFLEEYRCCEEGYVPVYRLAALARVAK